MSTFLRFDRFDVDLAAGRLLKQGARIRIREQSFQVLASLLERPGEVVTREELRRRLWPDHVFVDFENSLNTAVARLREALGDSAGRPRYIETLARRGYRFLAPVTVSEVVSEPTVVPRSKARLLVLPLANSSGDPEQEYFSDAMTDEIIAALAAFAGGRLAVIAGTTSMHYKGARKDVGRIGRELALDWLVEGSARREGNRVSLTLQLIRVSDQSHVFAQRYESDLADAFALQRSIAEALAKELGIGPARPAAAGQAPAPRKPTADLAAYTSYLLARQLLRRPADWSRARDCYEAAVARDPGFALAYDGLAELCWFAGFFGSVPPRHALSRGILHALRAVEIDGSLAEAHAQLAQFLKQLDFNWKEVEREMDLALALNPSSPIVRYRRALSWLMPHGLLDEAVSDLEIALDVDPLGTWPRAWLGIIHWLRRDFDASIQQARVLIEIDPVSFTGHTLLGQALCLARRFDESIESLRRAVELSGEARMVPLGWLGLALAQSGDVRGARSLYDQLRAVPPGAYVPPTSLAWIHVGLGEADGFFEWMDRAIDERDHMIMPIKTYPFFDSVRDDARYRGLLRKMNLA